MNANKYEQMSWIEINHAIAEIIEPNAVQIQESRFNVFEGDFAVEVFVDEDIVEYDFSKPSDAWSIIVENNISILLDGDDCEVSYDYETPVGKFGTDEILTFHINVKKEGALRAAMICFLMMKDAESNAN